MTDHELHILRAAKALIDTLLGASPASDNGNAPERANDRDLDSKWGDPDVKFHPRDWKGEACKGRRMSECPPEFLDLLAGTFDYFAKKADETGETTNAGKPVAPYKRKDAARARGWAHRIRGGWRPETVDEPAAGSLAEGFGDPAEPSGFDVSGFEEVDADSIPF
jgi:hypothetical protein